MKLTSKEISLLARTVIACALLVLSLPALDAGPLVYAIGATQFGTMCFATKSWTEIAHEFGYYDQMHMVHDFAEFTGGTPSEILNLLEAAFVEPIKQIRLSAVARNTIDRPRLIL